MLRFRSIGTAARFKNPQYQDNANQGAEHLSICSNSKVALKSGAAHRSHHLDFYDQCAAARSRTICMKG